MAKTLQEVIQSRLSQQPNQAGLGAGMQDTGAQIQNLLRAKAGKQVAGSGPAASSLAEQQAVTQTGQQLEGVQRRGQLVGLQQQQTGEAQEQAANIQSKQLEQKKEGFRQEAAQKSKSLTADFNRSKQEQDFKKSVASAEQLGFLSRLSNEKYIEQLQREGAKSRLDDQLSFKEKLQETIMEDSQDLLSADLDFKRLLNADQREFEKEMAQMDIDTAMRMMEQAIRAEAELSKYEAIGGIASTAIAGYGQYQEGAFDAEYQKSLGDKGSKASQYQNWKNKQQPKTESWEADYGPDMIG